MRQPGQPVQPAHPGHRGSIRRSVRSHAAPLAVVVAIVLLAGTACIPTRFNGYQSTVYNQDANWLCRPGTTATNYCVGSFLNYTVVNANGTTQVKSATPFNQASPTAPIDCFYVYPTVNFASGGGNDLAMASDVSQEVPIVQRQAARLTESCNVYAPLYRQMNFSAYGASNYAASQKVAYADVLDAFKQYMSHFNNGRPIVFVGHSQGSQMLLQLLQEQMDNDASFRPQLVSALLIGWPVTVPAGQVVGGSFKNIPLCQTTTQNGCVVNYSSYGTANPPSNGGFGMNGAACVNPINPAGGSGALKSYLSPGGIGGLPTISTSWVQLPGAASAQCISANGYTYLGITATPSAGDRRDLTNTLKGITGFGLHLNEFDLTEGNLIDLLHTEAAAHTG